MDLVADLIPLLGRPPDMATAERLAPLLAGPREDSQYDAVLYWTWKAAGVSVLFKADTMDDIQLCAIPSPGYSRFSGSLPGGLAVDACRREVRAALGAPTTQGAPEPMWCDAADYFHDDSDRHLLGYTYAWDRYDYAGYELQFQYDWAGDPQTGHRIGNDLWTGDADELRATWLRISRPGAEPWRPKLDKD